jgi:hypothetical protein
MTIIHIMYMHVPKFMYTLKPLLTKQVYTGQYQNPSSRIVTSVLSAISVGHLVALAVENCAEERLIGKDTEVGCPKC